jgi:mevalonate kinase
LEILNNETEQYMMEKAWMKQDRSTKEEVAETWTRLEAEFNEERKQMLQEIKELKQEF